MASQLQRLTHDNGCPVCTLYGQHGALHDGVTLMPPGSVGQGPVATFNILRADGSYVGYRLAALRGGSNWPASDFALALWGSKVHQHALQCHQADFVPYNFSASASDIQYRNVEGLS